MKLKEFIKVLQEIDSTYEGKDIEIDLDAEYRGGDDEADIPVLEIYEKNDKEWKPIKKWTSCL